MRLLLTLLAALAVTSCRVPPPDSTVGKLIRCGTDAVQANWHKALPGVNSCLGSEDGAPRLDSCLLGLIAPAAGITEDVLACVLRRQGERFASAASANPADERSARAAANAQGFMARRAYRFDDGTPGAGP